ncbi:enoyl-CoA hydratase-related protein [Marinobacter sp. 71-i]|uniref:Enoyl-CoA hydratase-related protein n=1 Tax=Marinobacter iranensis TaxID=2962607 RepID=A0ABT5YCU5_9GAMM|nr:enoyl-CoA hydratase-related protein [Marinobacter iranensis]MDF0750835.1 enoyl-CoA hydratase-related protein [Marinobacter iranensis]
MDNLTDQSTLFEGQSLWVRAVGDQLFELCFDRQDGSANKLDSCTLKELNEALAQLAQADAVCGLLVSSATDVFVVGADVHEFVQRFALDEAAIIDDVRGASDAFRALEDLPFPTVAAIGGYALGGGLELALACSFRVMSSVAQIGLPEVKLGLIPGAGGHVRLPRVAGISVALQWITEGNSFRAEAALAANVVYDVCEPNTLRQAALKVLQQAAAGDLDWQEERRKKCTHLNADTGHATHLSGDPTSKSAELPALAAVPGLLARCARLQRDAALEEELRTFAGIVRTPQAAQLVQAFIDAQAARRLARQVNTVTN